MIFALSWGNIRQRLKLGIKIILLTLIVCYILPKLFMLFLDFASPRKMPEERLLEKPLRVMLLIKN